MRKGFKLKNKPIYIDFDGTMIDIWERYYKILLDFFQCSNLSLDKYKELKLLFPNDCDLIQQLFSCKEEKKKQYFLFKKKYLEDMDYLKKDVLICNSRNLDIILNQDNIYILTVRREYKNLEQQMHNMNIHCLLKKTIVLEPKDIYVKKDWMIKNKVLDCYMIGDAETDMAVKYNSNIKTVFVKTGLRTNKQIDDRFHPDIISNDVNCALEFLLGKEMK